MARTFANMKRMIIIQVLMLFLLSACGINKSISESPKNENTHESIIYQDFKAKRTESNALISVTKIEEFEGKYIGICNEVLARNIFPQADPYWKEREKFHLPGANMAIPKEAYNQTSGFYAIPGAEDMMLGLDLVKAGFEIRQRIECLVRASNRISIRTQEGFGMGQRVKMLQSFEGDVFNFEGDQREFYQIRARLDEITDQIRNFPEAFESQVANLLQFHNIPVTGEQVAYWKIQWYEHCQAVPMLRFSEHPLIGLELQNLIRKKFPKINAWEHLNDSIIPFLKEYISDSLIEECENLMSLKPEESSVLLEHIS